MIEGYDIIFNSTDCIQDMDTCTRIIMKYWPNCRIENAITEEKYKTFNNIPFGMVTDLLLDEDQGDDSGFYYLIRSPGKITLCVNNLNNPITQEIIESIRTFLRNQR